MNQLDFYPIHLNFRSDISNMPIFTQRYYSATTGLVNQLYLFIDSILRMKQFNKNIGIIDSFVYCIPNSLLCPVGKIINLEKTSLNINNIIQFNHIVLIDRTNFSILIIDAQYGQDNQDTIDVTDI